MYSLYILCYRC